MANTTATTPKPRRAEAMGRGEPLNTVLRQTVAAADAANLDPTYLAALTLSTMLAGGGSVRSASLALLRFGFDLVSTPRGNQQWQVRKI